MPEEKIHYKWTEPKQIRDFYTSISKDIAVKSMPRTVILCIILTIVIYLFFRIVSPKGINPFPVRSLVMVFLLILLMCSFSFLLPLLSFVMKSHYEITEKRINIWSLTAQTVISWKKITGYSISFDSMFPDIVKLKIFSNHKPQILFISKGELSEKILALFQQIHLISEDNEQYHTKRFPLSDSELRYFLLFTLILPLFYAFFLYFYRSHIKIEVMLLVNMILGPGTIGCLTFYKDSERSFKDKISLSFLFNFIGITFFILYFISIFFYHYSKIIKDAGQ